MNVISGSERPTACTDQENKRW